MSDLISDEIQKMQDLEQAEIEKAFDLGYEEGSKSAIPGTMEAQWIRVSGDSRWKCSHCSWKENVPTVMGEPTIWDYCPSCGARILGWIDDET